MLKARVQGKICCRMRGQTVPDPLGSTKKVGLYSYISGKTRGCSRGGGIGRLGGSTPNCKALDSSPGSMS